MKGVIKMSKSNLMRRAHQIAKTFTGNYIARLSLALKMVWAELKGENEMIEKFKAARKSEQMEILEEAMKEKGLDYEDLNTDYREIKQFESRRIEAYKKALSMTKKEVSKANKPGMITGRQQDYLMSLIDQYPEFSGLRKDVANGNMTSKQASTEISFILSETK
jgi:hypothetical protein